MLAAWKGYPFPQIGWRRFSDPEKKTGGIEFWSDTAPKQIYGWVGDTRADYRRDYRLLGLRGNEEGEYWIPDFPEVGFENALWTVVCTTWPRVALHVDSDF